MAVIVNHVYSDLLYLLISRLHLVCYSFGKRLSTFTDVLFFAYSEISYVFTG